MSFSQTTTLFGTQSSPTVVLNSPSDSGTVTSLTPTLNFTGTDVDSNTLEYNLQIHTDNTFNSSNLLEDFETYSQWTMGVGSGSPSGSLSADTVNLKTGTQGMKITATNGGVYMDKTISLTMSGNIDFWFYIADKTNFASMTLYISSTSNFAKYFSLSVVAASVSNGWNHISKVVADWANTGSESWANTMITARFRIDSNASTTTSGTFDSLYDTTPILVNAFSSTDAGFTAGHPFSSGSAIDYTVQSSLTDVTTYYWRVRAVDPTGSTQYGAWSSTRSFQVNTAVPLTNSLISYYKLDESSGNASDSVGSNTLTNNGTSTYVAGKINNAVNFNGSNQYLNRLSNYGIAFNSSYTITGWVKLNNEITSGTWRLLNLNHSATGADTSQLVYEYNSGTPRIKFIRYNSGSVDTEPTYNVSLGTSVYHFVAITYNSSNTRMDIYLDGSSVTNTTSSNTVGTTGGYTQGFGVGSEPQTGTTSTDAKIDEIGVWSRVLSSAEITTLYNSGNGLQYPFTTGSVFRGLLLMGIGN